MRRFVGGISWLALTSASASAQTASAGPMAGNTVLWGALIAGTASLLALAGGKLLEIWIEHRRRIQRGTDLLCALHAEILAGVGASNEQLTPDERRYALSDATPFATPDDTDFVFAEVRGDISVLPQPVIHSVVAYYRKALQSNAMTTDLRDPCFLAQPEGHKRKFVRQLLEIANEQTHAELPSSNCERQRRSAVSTCQPPSPARRRLGRVPWALQVKGLMGPIMVPPTSRI